MGYGTAGMSLTTSVTDIRGPVKSLAPFFHKIFTVLVARWAGSAFDMTEYDFPTDILLLAVEAVDAKIFGIQEKSPPRIEIG